MNKKSEGKKNTLLKTYLLFDSIGTVTVNVPNTRLLIFIHKMSVSSGAVFDEYGWMLTEGCFPEKFVQVNEDGTYIHPETKEEIEIRPRVETFPDNYLVFIALYEPPRDSKSSNLTPRYIKRLSPSVSNDASDDDSETNEGPSEQLIPVLSFRRIPIIRERPLRSCIPTLQRGRFGQWMPQYVAGLSCLNEDFEMDDSEYDSDDSSASGGSESMVIEDPGESEATDDVVVEDGCDGIDDEETPNNNAVLEEGGESTTEDNKDDEDKDSQSTDNVCRRSARIQNRREQEALRALSAVQLHYVLYDLIFGLS